MGLRERMLGKSNGAAPRAGMDPARVREEYDRQAQRQVNTPEVTDDPEEQRDMSIEQGQAQGHGSSGRNMLTQTEVLDALSKGQCKFSAKKGGDLPQVHGKTLKAMLKAGEIDAYDKQGDEYVVTAKGDGEQRPSLPPTQIDQGRMSSTRPSVQSVARTDEEILDRADKWMRIFEALVKDDGFDDDTLEHHADAWTRFLADMKGA